MKKSIISAFLFLTLATKAYASIYIVKQGDTLTSIAQKLGIPLEKLKDANPNVKSSDLKIGQKILIPSKRITSSLQQTSLSTSQARIYIVQQGDNAYDIAKKLGCSLEALKKENPGINLANLNIGDRLIVPNASKANCDTKISNIYTVKKGDTAYTISKNYNIDISELKKLNPQLNLDSLNIGEKIILPSTRHTSTQQILTKSQDYYSVEPNDTLIEIAKKTGIKASTLKDLNPNVDWTDLQIGEKIFLKPHFPKTEMAHLTKDTENSNKHDENFIKYTVVKNDTLYSIAKAFSATTSFLKKINSLTSDNLSVGQTLLVPTKISETKKTQTADKIEISQNNTKFTTTPQSEENDIATSDVSENNTYSLYLDHYIVQKGDTLYTIAKKFNTSVDNIISLNNLPNTDISVGETLLVPNDNANTKLAEKNYSISEYSLVNKENSLSERLVKYAKLFVGTPYKWGGTNLSTGVDCSGFVKDVFAKFHIDLPRTSSEQFNVGKPVSLANIKPGDLLFFQTYNGTYPSHVGIYIGDNKFISALNKGSGVTISPLDSYFLSRFVGARRVLPSTNEKIDDIGNRPG